MCHCYLVYQHWLRFKAVTAVSRQLPGSKPYRTCACILDSPFQCPFLNRARSFCCPNSLFSRVLCCKNNQNSIWPSCKFLFLLWQFIWGSVPTWFSSIFFCEIPSVIAYILMKIFGSFLCLSGCYIDIVYVLSMYQLLASYNVSYDI